MKTSDRKRTTKVPKLYIVLSVISLVSFFLSLAGIMKYLPEVKDPQEYYKLMVTLGGVFAAIMLQLFLFMVTKVFDFEKK